MLLLFETPAGYSLFKVKGEKKLQDAEVRTTRGDDASTRRDATRRESRTGKEIRAFGGYDDCRHAANRIARAERDATRRDDRGESRDRVTIADVERARARSIEMERAVARATGRGATTTTRRDDDARRRDATRATRATRAMRRARAMRDGGDRDDDGGEATRAIGIECRTSAGDRLRETLAREGGRGFERDARRALRELVAMGYTAGEGAESAECDRDCVIGRAAMTRMEVEDIMYLSAAREVVRAGGGGGEASDARESAADDGRGRLRLMHRCQRLQELLPKGSDEFMINLVLRVIDNVSKHSHKVGLTHAVKTSTLADVYSKCASFGYFLQASERRLELEHFVSTNVDFVHLEKLAYPKKLARYGVLRSGLKALEGSTPSAVASRVAGYEVPVPLRVPGGIQIQNDMVSLKEYIDEMGPSARAHAARIASVEATEVLQLHVASLFAGDRGRVLTSLGQFRRKPHRNGGNDTADEQRVSVHVNQLKHIVLEACAFGATLAKIEASIDCESIESSKPLLTRL